MSKKCYKIYTKRNGTMVIFKISQYSQCIIYIMIIGLKLENMEEHEKNNVKIMGEMCNLAK
jgi:hypothetical protein